MWKKKKVNVDNYNSLLEKENEALKRRITHLESERRRAAAEKDRMAQLLERYKSEYETLISDAKKLIEKQKHAASTVETIIDECKKELLVTQNNEQKKAGENHHVDTI